MIVVAKLPAKQQIELWSKVPHGALSGPCSSPLCRNQKCLDPRITVTDLSGDPYSGPFVILSFSWPGVHVFRINGEDYQCSQWPVERLHGHLRRRYGKLAVTAFEHHMTPVNVDERFLN